MPKLILLETSTSLLSVALACDGRIADFRECTTPRSHAAMTVPLVNDLLKDNGLKVGDCDAVCISSGPGSYTGLRVGSSTAKGLCFGAGLPRIAVCTLDVPARQAVAAALPDGCRTIIPMVDARRMEVYSAVYDSECRRLTPVEATVVDGSTYRSELSKGPAVVIGDGAEKCRGVLEGDVRFIQTCPRADAMLQDAVKAFDEKRFEDIAYFEPFYLKEFVATTSRKALF
ncbi:MAG: tRNA (adenosine(37)-N6)-threonylcarbamoyltransferase complex dimerization subunit type 1 TsaB [Bacteroidales bacterium]|nr:tRNA (adenosine(37)-N6)-threonylcarbamoyltransferase complex dimerization subunit type 1 TsaB [Bacteroidales bacterium]